MKTVQKLRTDGKSCSCTTCVYKSECDQPSLRRFIADGSRIDRLYYGKYIPLREKKLLDRLVRTRAVYDDIRARLISDSTVSLSTVGDFRKKKSSIEYDADKSNAAILKFVNMVDKGATPGSAKLSDCCSCCSCSSRLNVQEHSFKRHRQKRPLVSTYDYLNARDRARETYNRKKGVRFKAKHIRSDPCTCTFKFSGLLKKQSKTLLKRIHPPFPLPTLDLESTTDQDEGLKRGLGDIAHTSYQNLKQTNVRFKGKISEGMAKIKQSQTRIREKLEVQTNKSLEKLTQAKNKLTSKIKASAQKLTRVKTKPKTMCLCPNKELAFQVKKDSISKFKEDLRRKQIMKDWECEPECSKNTCIPEECFIKLKEKKSKRKKLYHKNIKYQNMMKERKAGELLNRSDTKIQTENLTVAKTVITEKSNSLILADHIQAVKQPHVGFDKTSNGKKITHMKEKNNICACETFIDTHKKNKVEPSISLTKKAIKNTMQNIKVSHRPKNYKVKNTNVENNYKDISRTMKLKESPLDINIEKQNAKASSIPKKPKVQRTNLERKSSQRQAVRIGSSFSFNIEFYKNKMDPKISFVQLHNTPTDSKRRSGIDYRYVKSKKDETKKRPLRHKGSQIILKKPFKDNQTGGYALKRCFCTLMLKAKATKSKIRRPITNKVKTSEKSVLTLNSFVLSHKMLNLNEIQTNTLHKKIMNRKRKNESNLLPYECESGVCVPGDCNPDQCIQLINMREDKHKTLPASCVCPANLSSSRKTKSTSSFTSRSYKPSKAKYVQSMVTYRDHIYSRPAVGKKHIRRTIEKKSDRQAVRVGSTFSFNIEFYKGMPTYNSKPTELKSLSIKPKQKTYQMKVKEHRLQENIKYIRRNTPTQMRKKERNVLIGTSLKRCFCTLKLQKSEILKTRSKKTFTKGTKPVDPSHFQIDTANKSTKTKSKFDRKLEPFECAPFTCIPGSCDPYICWDVIKKRNMRLKEVGFTTKRPGTKTSSTTYTGKPLKNVQIQYKPKHKQHKILAQTQNISAIPKPYTEKKPFIEYSSTALSNQVVKIGSTFSFDIEFHKTKAPTKIIPQSYPSEKTIKSSTLKILKNKSIKRNQLNVAHIDTQVDGPKKKHKSFIGRPFLNKCFCTLDLQKRRKKYFKSAPVAKPIFPPEKNYTVNTAILQNTQLFTSSKYQINGNEIPSYHSLPKYMDRNLLSEKISLKINPMYVTTYRQNLPQLNYRSGEVRAWQPVKTSSYMPSIFDEPRQSQKTLKIYPLNQVKKIENFVNETVDFKNFKGVQNSTSQIQYESDNSLNPAYYFGRCFYTMNLKVKNGGISQRRKIKNDTQLTTVKKRALLKLKSYECEPGICIPGECNPYVCQKIISKRLRKNNIKKSGTNYKSKSVGSFASVYLPQSKSSKQQTLSLKSRKPTVYKERSKNRDKQAVRIGSSFSFDIHFSKNVSASEKDVFVPKYSSDTKITHRTIKKQKNINSHAESGFLKTKNKKSLTKPTARRCFCTLKLQKKGRLQKKIQNMRPITSNEFLKVKTTSRGQNTKKFKPLYIAHSLKPYECEPNICIPGQCDPYSCLEIMKKRNYNKHHHEFGASTLPNNKSISSMTDDQQKKLNRSRAISVNAKYAVNDTAVVNNYFDNCVTKTSPNTLKVGSSFSFNVEFFKDRSPVYNYLHKDSKQKKERKNEKNRFLKKPTHLPNERYRSGAMREHSSNYKAVRHTQSQIENFAHSASTLTDRATKHCSCTVPLYEPKNVQNIIQSQANKHSNSVLNKCLCFIKRMKRPKNLHMNKKLKRSNTLNKIINTQNVRIIPKQLPYECAQGICVPGEYNPYLCEKNMGKRPDKKSFKASTSDTLNTQSVSNNSPTKISKNVNTHIKQTRNSKSIKKADGSDSDKRIVSIGSKFSFDIEFYKKNPTKIKEYERSDSRALGKVNWTKYSKNKNFKTPKELTRLVANSAQVHNNTEVKNHATGLNNLIKRCLCTLKIKGNNNNLKDYKKKKEENSAKVKTKSVMAIEKREHNQNELKPFECEPNICTPYRCNPYACEKLMQLRHKGKTHQEFGVAAIYPRKMSTANITDFNKKSNIKSGAIMKKNITPRKKEKILKKYDTESIVQSKQSVRLGSTFGFNIKFTKDKHDHLEKYGKKKTSRTNLLKREIYKRKMISNQTYTSNDKMRSLSTMTGLFSPLKRCFCTLSLRKHNQNQGLPVKKLTASIGTKTDAYKITKQPVLNLLPYECEPNICIPDKCNPIECLDRIKKRCHKNTGTVPRYILKKNLAVSMSTGKHKIKNNISQLDYSKHPMKSSSYISYVSPKQKFEKGSFKQAVRIGSTFSFDMEFFKNKTSENHERFKKTTPLQNYKMVKEKFQIKMDENDMRKNNKLHKYSNKDLLKKNWSIQKENEVNTKRKNTSINPLHKRCFCVFKLHKIRRHRKHSVLLKNKINQSQIVEYDKEKNRARKLEPFEWEPNVCIPGKCNPYKCEQRIRKRHLKEFGTDAEKSHYVSTFSETNKPILKPVKMQTSKMKSSEYKNIYVKKTDVENVANRNVVRIGSNFSFDVEFSKARGPKDIQVFNKREVKSKMKRSCHKIRNQSLQVNKIKKDSKTVAVEPFFKRCFCTLKLQKMINKKQHILTENKCSTTNKTFKNVYELSPYECEPFYCIPGECDPFLCEKRIKLREKEKIIRNTPTQVIRKYSEKRVGLKEENYKSQKNQTYNFDVASPIAPHDRLGIVEIPRFTNFLNREAVRVGSNFSFNLEFYKETMPQTDIVKFSNDRKFKIKNQIKSYNNYPKIDVAKFKTRGSQVNKVRTRDTCINAENALKRCFCTLKLQNRNKLKTENLMPLVKRTQFPQNIEVRRVAAQYKSKMLPNYTNIEVKSIGTKINKKYIQQNTDCNFCLCQNGPLTLSEDMKTILPYRPKKFNKNFSLTNLHLQNFTPMIAKKYKEPQEKVTTRGKRLIRTKSERKLIFNKEPMIRENTIPKVKFPGFKHFVTRCVQKLLRVTSKYRKIYTHCDKPKNVCAKNCNFYNINKPDHQNKIIRDGLKPSKSERPARFNPLITHSQPKKTKSLKFKNKYEDKKKCKKTCPYYANQTNKKMFFQCGDIKCVSPVMSLKIKQKQITKYNMNELLEGKNMHAQKTLNMKTKPNSLKQLNNEYLCNHCLMKHEKKKPLITSKGYSIPLKVHFMDVAASKTKFQHKKSNVKKNVDVPKMPIKHATKSERLVLSCKCVCHSCGRQLNKYEFDKAAGDQLLKQTKSSQIKSSTDKENKKRIIKNCNVCSVKESKKPLFELHLDSSSYDILNKDEVNYNVTKFSKSSKKKLLKNKDANKIHGKSCQCCICRANQDKNESKINIITAKAPKVCKTLSFLFHDPKTKIKTASGKPCVCGSLICAKKAHTIANKPNLTKERYKWKPCVCGSTVCNRESAVIKTISGTIKCICLEQKEKRNKKLNAKKLKKEKKERSVRLKQQNKDDRKRFKKRRKEHKLLERKINKNASDVALLTDTVIDIGKLGVTACSDILRVVARSAHDPKHACKTLKTIKDNPNLLIKNLKSAYADSGVAATTRRVRLRCLAMRGVKTVKAKLDSYAITKYLLNIASKDPKSRIVKPQRVRERFDFGCSLYMGSLRKRPFLSIYDRCPVFYPHCLALVNVWKQFMDISLFLLAVVVWSPCILCMELCRACMCCFFCTG